VVGALHREQRLDGGGELLHRAHPHLPGPLPAGARGGPPPPPPPPLPPTGRVPCQRAPGEAGPPGTSSSQYNPPGAVTKSRHSVGSSTRAASARWPRATRSSVPLPACSSLIPLWRSTSPPPRPPPPAPRRPAHPPPRGGEPRLLVRGAAAVHEAVLNGGAEGIARPCPAGLDGDGVHVAVEDERGPSARARPSGPEVRATAIVQDRLEPARLQRFQGGQRLIGQDEIVLPVGRVLGHRREPAEEPLDVRLTRLDGETEGIEAPPEVFLAGPLLAGQARRAHEPRQEGGRLPAPA